MDTRYFQRGQDLGQSSFSAYKLAPTIEETVSGVKTYARTHLQYYGAVVTYDENSEIRKQFFEEDYNMYFVDQAFFEMFDYKLKAGNRETLLTEPNSIVITESMVRKYMPGEPNPIGKFLRVDGGWYPGTFKITGILEDLPGNSLFSFNFLMSIDDVLKNEQYTNDDGWGWSNFVSYLMLEEKASMEQVSELAVNTLNELNEEDNESSNSRNDVVLTSLNDIHLRDKIIEDQGGVSDETLFFFTLIAIFIIGIAWLNYINLATAQALKRSKEVGIRKVVGAVRMQLVSQFLLEAFIINTIALILGFAIAYFTLPILGGVLDQNLIFGIGIQTHYWIYFGLVFIIGSFLSGFYPAIVLSGFDPSVVVKGISISRNRRFGLRQVLVVVQLIIGVFLIGGTLAVYKQLSFMRNQDLGMDVEQVMSMRGPRVVADRDEMRQKMKAFQDKLSSMASISEVSGSDAIPGGEYNWGTSMIKEGQDDSEGQSVKMMWVDENFHKTYGLELLAGRFHDRSLRGDERQVVVNETLLEKFDMGTPEEALGQRMKVGNNIFPIIGVLQDFNWYSLKQEKEPILLNYTQFGSNISVRLSSSDIRNTMETIQGEYEAYFPNNPFDYYFMDDFFDRQYKSDQQFGQIFSAFSLVAIIIACLGMFGLASFTLNLRVKEIGVRKVLGASISSILLLIYKDYLKLIVIASVIGIPAVYFAIKNWLEGYAYRINISVDLMVLPIMILMLIAIVTISYQSFRAALSNPTNSLRSE